MINLSNTDDPHLIFESLNFKGSPLTQADLVRNYLLMRFRHSVATGGEQERIYQSYWSPLEKLLGEKLTDFLRFYAMKHGDNVRVTEIYTAIKKQLKEFDLPDKVELEMASILRFGKLYAKIIQPTSETNQRIRACLENIKTLEITTSHPLLLRLLDIYEAQRIDDSTLQKCLVLIESFVVRRAVCAIPTNALNKMFLQWAKNFPSENYDTWLLSSMSSGTGGQQFPDDELFADSFKNKLQYGRGATKFILSRLEESFSHKEVVDLNSCTIEHVLPQTLTDEWREILGENADEVHRKIVDTFGNLTLTAYNSELSNNSFTDKKDRLKNSHIELNRLICEQEKWGGTEIAHRADDLFNIAQTIWTGPSTTKN